VEAEEVNVVLLVVEGDEAIAEDERGVGLVGSVG
jgi:hypothetical protein